MRRFTAGMAGDIGGVQWRVVQGKKSPSDLRLDICCPQFVPVKMDVGFLFADFYADNERVLAAEGYLTGVAPDAGARYITFLKGAQFAGWEVAADQLHLERAAKAAKRAA